VYLRCWRPRRNRRTTATGWTRREPGSRWTRRNSRKRASREWHAWRHWATREARSRNAGRKSRKLGCSSCKAVRLLVVSWKGSVKDLDVPAQAHHVENGGELHFAGFWSGSALKNGLLCSCGTGSTVRHQAGLYTSFSDSKTCFPQPSHNMLFTRGSMNSQSDLILPSHLAETWCIQMQAIDVMPKHKTVPLVCLDEMNVCDQGCECRSATIVSKSNITDIHSFQYSGPVHQSCCRIGRSGCLRRSDKHVQVQRIQMSFQRRRHTYGL